MHGIIPADLQLNIKQLCSLSGCAVLKGHSENQTNGDNKASLIRRYKFGIGKIVMRITTYRFFIIQVINR